MHLTESDFKQVLHMRITVDMTVDALNNHMCLITGAYSMPILYKFIYYHMVRKIDKNYI